eukprot:TRINITY_DN105389_c0_g1_i1.p1 TRINITY_DN105389_c0_g1~~TRINITY_DN105389_c0_g1_i1.p1  ORF type:complete len:250 (+),score=26.69 TRINITY_DN105389_c0_g1_i1:187-936(+)
MHATDSCGTGTGYTNASSNKSSAQLGIGALSRVLAPRPIVVADACFQVTVAPSVSGRTDFILYVLDPEPERFALVTTNLYGLQGYYRDGDEGATALRHVAVAGFGRAPLAFDQNPSGFDSAKLSELRRADFTGSGGASQFLEALYKAVLLVEEELLQLPKPLTSSQRAVSGNVLWQLSEHTRQKSPDFAAKMDTFADILARRNHNVTRQSLSHGTHHTVKPLVVLMELQWLEDLIGSRAVTELTTQSEP